MTRCYTEDLEHTPTWAEEAFIIYIRCVCDRTHMRMGGGHFLQSSKKLWDPLNVTLYATCL